MILSPQTIRKLGILTPCMEGDRAFGVSYGLSHAGYDLRIAEDHWLRPGGFILASAIEEFSMPSNVVGIVHDKSTWARRGVSVFNTVIEPGWQGFLTMELVHHGENELYLQRGMGIAQVIFHFLDEEASRGYSGKYQHQKQGPQPAIHG